MSCLLVFNLPNTITKENLRKQFSQKGCIKKIQLMFDINKKNCHFAIISFQTKEEATDALNYFDNFCPYHSYIKVHQCSELEGDSELPNPEVNNKISIREYEQISSLDESIYTYFLYNLNLYFNNIDCQRKHDLSSIWNNVIELFTTLLKNSFGKNYKQICSVLDEITPSNLILLTESFKALPMDNITLDIFFDFIFKKFFNHNLTIEQPKYLTSTENKSIILSKAQLTIQDVIYLPNNKWILPKCYSKSKLINELDKYCVEQSIPQKEEEKDNGSNSNNKFINKAAINTMCEFIQTTPTVSSYESYENVHYKPFLQEHSITIFSYPAEDENSTFTGNKTSATSNDDKQSITLHTNMSNKSKRRKSIKTTKTGKIRRNVSDVEFSQAASSLNSTVSSYIIQEPAEISSKSQLLIEDFNSECINIIKNQFGQKRLDVVICLLKNKNSAICTRHELFVISMVRASFHISIDNVVETGTMFGELLSLNVLSMISLTNGIAHSLKTWKKYLPPKLPQYMINLIIFPILYSTTSSFYFNNLQECMPKGSTKLFPIITFELFNHYLLTTGETQNITKAGCIIWTYYKWMKSEYIPLNEFIPADQLIKHYKNNRVGMFFMSITMYDAMKAIESKLLYVIMISWIRSNFKREIIKSPIFVRALTIAIVMICLNSNNSFENFFQSVHLKLLTNFIRSEEWVLQSGIQKRELQCLYGVQIMFAALEYPDGMILKIFNKLYQDDVINKESFYLWKNEDVFISDREPKHNALSVLDSFFYTLEINGSAKDGTVMEN